ncbi:MAG: alpha/beta hydrolase-fold protein [Polyangiaceae bacterium]
MDFWSRRSWLLGVLSAAAAGCGSKSAPKEQAPGALARGGWRDESFERSEDQPDGQRALVLAAPEGEARPVLVALHGRGEAGRGLDAGARGWRDDYDLDAMIGHLAAGSLASDHVGGMLDEDRLAKINASLAANPWQGLVVVCPYTPVPTGRDEEASRPFGRFVTGPLLERVTSTKAASAIERKTTGIDGVSMGGRYALELGFGFPDTFGAVGALQPAMRESEADAFADRALRASEHGPQQIRLVSSEEDPFLEPTKALARALDRRKLEHRLLITKGPHDYVWNRGPGGAELLIFHERALRGLPLA